MSFPVPQRLHRMDAAHSRSMFSIFFFLFFTKFQVFSVILVYAAQTLSQP